MTHEIDHILCGGVGKGHGEKTIIIHDHEVLNAAVHLKHDNLVAFYKSQGMTSDKAVDEAMKKGKRIQRFWDDLYEDFKKEGLWSHAYPPNPANF